MALKRTTTVPVRPRPGRNTGAEVADPPRFVEIFAKDGLFQADAATHWYDMSKAQLAETAGISPESLYRKARAESARVQSQ